MNSRNFLNWTKYTLVIYLTLCAALALQDNFRQLHNNHQDINVNNKLDNLSSSETSIELTKRALELNLNQSKSIIDLAPKIEVTALTMHSQVDSKFPAEMAHKINAISEYIAKRWRVAPSAIMSIVHKTFDIGAHFKLDPLLILAVMATESGFNPYAQSGAGAQGLMQVMTRVHADRYKSFGGPGRALDIGPNIFVGAQILKESIVYSGSIDGGLRRYAGATSDSTYADYGIKVANIRANLNKAAELKI